MKKTRKLLCHTPFVDLYESRRGFFYAERKGVDSIAALCFRNNPDGTVDFFVHYQPMPEIVERKRWTQMYPCPITGSIEPNESPLVCALREVDEEGGIRVQAKNYFCSQKAIATTQMNEQVYHFLFDVTGLKQSEPKTDGTIFEELADNKWVSQRRLEHMIFNDKQVKIGSLLICYLLWLKHTNK